MRTMSCVAATAILLPTDPQPTGRLARPGGQSATRAHYPMLRAVSPHHHFGEDRGHRLSWTAIVAASSVRGLATTQPDGEARSRLWRSAGWRGGTPAAR